MKKLRNNGKKVLCRAHAVFGPECAIVTRAKDGAEVRGLRAVVSVTDKKYELGRLGDIKITETVQAGAFKKTLEENKNILVLREHNRELLISNTGSGLARVWEERDSENGVPGLYVEIPDIGDSQKSIELWKDVRDGKLREGSFGYWPVNEVPDDSENEYHTILTEARVQEVSFCALGANPLTKAEIRSQYELSDESEPGENHSRAGATARDGADDETTLEPESNHSEVAVEEVARALALRRRRLALRIKLSEVK